MTKKEKIVSKAKDLAIEYGQRYVACAPTVFAAICDALRSEGIELFTPEVQEQMFKGIVALEGGTAAQGTGACGAVAASVFLVSYVTDIGTRELTEDPDKTGVAHQNAIKGVISKFMKEYGTIVCRDIRFKRTGRIYSFLRTDTVHEMKQFMKEHTDICGIKDVTSNHPVITGSGWGAGAVCDLKGIE